MAAFGSVLLGRARDWVCGDSDRGVKIDAEFGSDLDAAIHEPFTVCQFFAVARTAELADLAVRLDELVIKTTLALQARMILTLRLLWHSRFPF